MIQPSICYISPGHGSGVPLQHDSEAVDICEHTGGRRPGRVRRDRGGVVPLGRAVETGRGHQVRSQSANQSDILVLHNQSTVYMYIHIWSFSCSGAIFLKLFKSVEFNMSLYAIHCELQSITCMFIFCDKEVFK